MKIGAYETHPAADLFPMLEEAQLDSLARDIKARGLMHPVVRLGGLVLDGRNRLAACLKADVPPRFVEHDGGNPWHTVWSLNAERRQIEDKIRLVLIRDELNRGSDGWEAKQREAKEAANKARSVAQAGVPKPKPVDPVKQEERRPSHEGPRSPPAPMPAPKPPERDRSEAARAKQATSRIASETGVSRATVERALSLKANAPEVAARVKAGEVVGSKAIAEVKLQAKRDLAEELRKEPPPAPKGPFRVIVIDPPWRYDSRAEDASHRGRNQYPDMSTEEICALPVGGMAHPEGCVLWLWTTNAFMRDAYRCLDAWGFQEKTILTWDKERLGMGDWLRNVTEHCILAVKGRPLVTLTNQTTMIREVRREHSRKPEAFYSLVSALCPGSKVEMFSREEREGWAAWGAETGKFGDAA